MKFLCLLHYLLFQQQYLFPVVSNLIDVWCDFIFFLLNGIFILIKSLQVLGYLLFHIVCFLLYFFVHLLQPKVWGAQVIDDFVCVGLGFQVVLDNLNLHREFFNFSLQLEILFLHLNTLPHRHLLFLLQTNNFILLTIDQLIFLHQHLIPLNLLLRPLLCNLRNLSLQYAYPYLRIFPIFCLSLLKVEPLQQ